jgi:thiol-disulfide isomerase/thioredoxin
MTNSLPLRFAAALLLSVFALSTAGAQGMSFSDKSWSDILAQAKQQNKIIFLDAYTSWCGPCKMMARNTFTDAEVGKFYNANFVNAKIDMEKGEGPDLAQRYNVEAYPTLLYINGNGDVVHRALGYHEPEQFLAVGRKALDPASNLTGIEARYQAGERSGEFLLQYLEAKRASGDDQIGNIVEQYLEANKDWTQPQTREVIFRYVTDLNAPAFQYILDNRAAFVEQFGQEALDQQLDAALGQYFQTLTDLNPEQLRATMVRIYGPDGGQKTAMIMMMVHQQMGDSEAYATAAVDYLDKYPSDDALELNQIAWNFYLMVDDKPMLEKALGWAQKSVSLQEEYANQDTLAALYFKLKEKKKAKKHAERAIELAKVSGEDYAETEALLARINKL